MNFKFSKLKVHWQTHNHCLFVAYLATVAFWYGWISDTKFQKFSDKDWVWTYKNFSDMDQELKIKIRPPLLPCGKQRLLSVLSKWLLESSNADMRGQFSAALRRF